MILHSVYCAIRDDVSPRALAEVMAQLAALKDVCAGLLSFEAGPNIDLEQKSQDYTHGFVMRFESQEALEAYARHPAHIEAGTNLVMLCAGGGDGIMVFDLEI